MHSEEESSLHQEFLNLSNQELFLGKVATLFLHNLSEAWFYHLHLFKQHDAADSTLLYHWAWQHIQCII
jgi:hypothetical protein